MTGRNERLSDAALAEQLLARERDDGVAIHPAVGVRIEKQIEDALAQRRSQSGRMLRVATALVAGIALGVGWMIYSDPPSPRGEGPVVESLVRARDRIVSLELAPGKHAELQPGSALIPSVVPEVLTGTVLFEVSTASDDAISVRASDVTVEAADTIFTVRRIGDLVDVAVRAGTARVSRGPDRAIVEAGGHWSTAPKIEPTLPPEQTLQPDPEPPPVESRVARLLKRSHRHQAPEEPSKQEVEVDAEADALAMQPAKVRERSLLEAAAERLRAGDVGGARAIYRELAEGEESSRALGLYSLARLEARHAGDPEAALAALDRFLDEFPSHTLAAEAAAGRIEALLDLARCDEAGQALATFGERHTLANDLVSRSKVRHLTDCERRDEHSGPGDH